MTNYVTAASRRSRPASSVRVGFHQSAGTRSGAGLLGSLPSSVNLAVRDRMYQPHRSYRARLVCDYRNAVARPLLITHIHCITGLQRGFSATLKSVPVAEPPLPNIVILSHTHVSPDLS